MTVALDIQQTITWVYTDDVDQTCKFYSDILGLKLIRDADVARIYRLTETSNVGVCEALDWRVVEPRGSMLTLVTDDVDKWFAHLKGAAVPYRSEPERIAKFGIYALLVEDPNGYLIEFQQFLD